MTPPILRWAVAILELDPTVGHEQSGTRRVVIVSRESFHRSGMASVCPITTRAAKYPGEVAIAAGQAGQTQDGLILCHQIRTVDLDRVRAFEVGGQVQYVIDPTIRADVRRALARHLGLDMPAIADGAAR
jgi:mRNA-degrading endonuclease toxin of MazEF toxin-antitoxin module